MDNVLAERGRLFSNACVKTRRQRTLDLLQNKTEGYVNLGCAENQVVTDLVKERMSRPDMTDLQDSDCFYAMYDHGEKSFRKSVCEFLNTRLRAKHAFDPQKMVIVCGAGTSLNLLGFTIADPEDCFLCPAPYYYSTNRDIGDRNDVKCLAVQTHEVNEKTGQITFNLTVDKLDTAYNEYIQQGRRIRGVILINPHNPTGDLMNPDLMQDIMHWAAKLQLHVVLDEIYALTVFEGDFRSVCAMDQMPDPHRTHVMWGFSKDLTLSGFRCGLVHSWSQEVADTMKRLSWSVCVPPALQRKLKVIIEDKDWLDDVFFPTNFKRLTEGRDYVCKRLDDMGVPHNKPGAAFFIWADFSQYVSCDFSEDDLFMKFLDAGVFLEPNESFFSTCQGYFRILFSMPHQVLEDGLNLIHEVLKTLKLSEKSQSQ